MMLGLGRALGETLAALMVIGSLKDRVPPSIFQPGITSAALIASELPNANDELHESTLILIALVLFGITPDLEQSGTLPCLAGRAWPGRSTLMSIVVNAPNIGRRKAVDRTMRGCALLATVIAMVPLILILGFVLVRGVSSLNVAFFTQSYKPPALSLGGDGAVQAQGGVLNGIVGSLVLVFWSTVFALPIGLLAGVFLAEYKTNTVATVVRFCTDVLSAAPSIVVGVVVYALIVLRTKSFSGWAGSIALAILMVPLITRTTEEICGSSHRPSAKARWRSARRNGARRSMWWFPPLSAVLQPVYCCPSRVRWARLHHCC